MIKVCGHRILVKPILLKESDEAYKKAAQMGLEVVRDPLTTAREHESVDQGVIQQIGPTAWNHPDFGGTAWAKVADTVVYAKGAGKKVVDPDTKEIYIALNDEDIVAVTKEAQ